MFKVNTTTVRRLLFERGLSVREFASATGLNTLTAAKLTRDGATASLKTIGAVAKFFGVDGNELIVGSKS